MITCSTHDEALSLAIEIFPYHPVELDHAKSLAAGYPVYYAKDANNAYICDLESRIELNYPEGTTKLIHIDRGDTFNSQIQTTIVDIVTVKPFEYDGTGFDTINSRSYLGDVNIVFDTDAHDKYVMKVFDSNGLLLYSRIVDRVVYLKINQVKPQCQS